MTHNFTQRQYNTQHDGQKKSAVATKYNAPRVFSKMGRGINLGGWFVPVNSQSTGIGVVKDIPALNSIPWSKFWNHGVRHIRLPFDPTMLFTDGSMTTFDPAVIAKYDQVVADIVKNGFICIIDNHPINGTNKTAADTNLANIWAAVAGRYAPLYTPDQVIFEVLNEPSYTDRPTWVTRSLVGINAIRAVTLTHAVMVDANYTAAYNFYTTATVNLTPFVDRNIIYSFHYYNPFTFTAQNCFYITPFNNFKDIHYPTNTVDITNKANAIGSAATSNATVQYEMANTYNYSLIFSHMNACGQWGQLWGVPVHVGEIGVFLADTYSPGHPTPTPDRQNWYKDVVTACDNAGLKACVWSYIGADFGIGDEILAQL